MELGQAFLQNTFTRDNHIWVVAYKSDTSVVIFNFTSYGIDKDHSCLVTPAEYSELHHDSIIAYGGGRLIEGEKIAVFENVFIRSVLSPVSSTVLSNIA